ncbi:MAG TPA: hypothetical protein VK992_04770, partial [Candidatus Caenarcaniphilales bacterium]|nr:hypothetical protein [Candidatus Caenarcaniphilales bacterium]
MSQLYAWDLDAERLTQVTDRPVGAVHGQMSADGRHVYYLDDSKGDEIGHWVAVPATGDGQHEDLTPTLPGYTSHDLTPSGDGRRLAFTAAMEDGHAVYVVYEAAGVRSEPRVIYRTSGLCWTIGFDADARLLGVMSSERTGRARFSLIVFDVESGERVAELWDGPESSISGLQFSPAAGDARAVGTSDATGDRRPLLWDPQSGRREELPVAGPGETFPLDWSPDGREILLCRVHAAVQELSVYESESGRLRRLDHPPGVYGFFGEIDTWFDGAGGIIAQWQDATHPPTVMLLDAGTGRPIRELLPPSPVPVSRPWRSVTFAVDGHEQIQAWLATPEGSGPFPAVIDTHGGPESVAMESFAPRGQSWVDMGF